MSNRSALQRAMRSDTQITGDLPASALNTDQVNVFYEMASTAEGVGKFFSEIPYIIKTAKSGAIPRLTVGSRLIRAKTQAVDDGYRAKLESDSVPYACVASRLPMEIAEEVFEENIQGEQFERTTLRIMTQKAGVDIEDLSFNGDTTTDVSDSDYDFLSMNNGILKIVTDGGNVVNGATYNSGDVHENMFFDAARLIPGHHIISGAGGSPDLSALSSSGYRWCTSFPRYVSWLKYCAARADLLGESAFKQIIGSTNAPLGIPFSVMGANFPDSKILFAKPSAFKKVFTNSLRIRKTTEGREAIMRDVRFYVIHLQMDVVMMEDDAASIIYGLTS